MLGPGSLPPFASTPAPPCTHNNRWFSDGSSQRISHERHPGWSRWYASVLRPGHVATGDPVRIWSTGSGFVTATEEA